MSHHPVERGMESLYEEPFIRIQYEAATKILICDWIGFQTSEGIQKAGHVILELIKQRGLKKILNSNLKVIGPWNEATQWTYDVWFPSVINAGLLHFAWVLSANGYAELSARKAMPSTSIIKAFFNFEEAYAWLKNC